MDMFKKMMWIVKSRSDVFSFQTEEPKEHCLYTLLCLEWQYVGLHDEKSFSSH